MKARLLMYSLLGIILGSATEVLPGDVTFTNDACMMVWVTVRDAQKKDIVTLEPVSAGKSVELFHTEIDTSLSFRVYCTGSTLDGGPAKVLLEAVRMEIDPLKNLNLKFYPIQMTWFLEEKK